MKKNHSRRRTAIIFITAIVLILTATLFVLYAFNTELFIQFYMVSTEKIDAPVRIVLITDLHSCKYGENQSELISAIDQYTPDLILLGGDIFDDDIDNTNAQLLMYAIGKKYPCYYVTGNHEFWCDAEEQAANRTALEEAGIQVLSGTFDTVDINGQLINVCGVDDPDMRNIALARYSDAPSIEQQMNSIDAAVDYRYFTVLLSHRPEYFDVYRQYEFDLVLCGHAHGGQWRIPYILNGLLAPNQGFFPKYAGGKYTDGRMVMIVSRGLARETTLVPRIFNRPELVVIDIVTEE